MEKGTFVCYARLPQEFRGTPLASAARMLDVVKCKNEKVRREKFFVWKLLEKAVREYYNLDFAKIRFTKTENNKWICDDFCFSLSHSGEMLAVAISPEPIGVDLEAYRPLRSGIEGRILTEREIDSVDGLVGNEREERIIELWCSKEAIFKKGGSSALLPASISVAEHKVNIKKVTLDGAVYCIAAATSLDVEYSFKEL